MDAKAIALLIVCIAAVALAGCTGSLPDKGPISSPVTPPATTLPATTTPADAQGCTAVQDCVPAQCCHPTGCTVRAQAPDCTGSICTMSCEGPIDCGAGSCGCVGGKCAVVPAPPAKGQAEKTSVRLEASPQRYSPMMSSTVGVRLTPTVTGFNASEANFEWNATFGRFLMWDAPDYKVHDIRNPVVTDGRTIYWTFIDKPASTREPVTITVTARDMTRPGAVLGTSMVTLSWDGDTAVYVGEGR